LIYDYLRSGRSSDCPLHLSLFLEMYDTSIFGAFLTGTIKMLNVFFLFVCPVSGTLKVAIKRLYFGRYCSKKWFK